MKVRVLLLALLGLGAADSDSLSIRLAARVLMLSRTTKQRVTCHVPRRPGNRWLDMGLVDGSTSGHQLDGDAARVTWEQWYPVDCSTTVAFCRVTDNMRREETVQQTFQVEGCEQ